MFVKFLIYYLLPWPKYNEISLRTKAKNMGSSNNKTQICEIKNWCKIKDRTAFAIVTLLY